VTFEKALKSAFVEAPGETRRPENEVTLWDWSSGVAAFYKASLAGAVLGHQPDPKDLHWRFLSLRVDSVTFTERVARLPDLLARQNVLADAFERVRVLLEETYPLGTKVYQDEGTSLYVVPDLPDLLCCADDHGTTLDRLIHAQFGAGTVEDSVQLALSGEVMAQSELDTRSWWGQRPEHRTRPTTDDQIPPIADLLGQPIVTHADPLVVAAAWNGVKGDICSVCGVRPQGPREKALARKVCDVCERRRADRARAWAGDLDTTVWTDEVADSNGRLALIVGQFDLTHWLDGSVVQTLLVTDPAAGAAVRKNPSFARLRRVWETTRAFWQGALTEPSADGQPVLAPAAPRLEIIPQERDRLDLGQFHTYELALGQARVSVVWDSDRHRFITCDNLAYLKKAEQWGRPLAEALRCRQTVTVEEPAGYGGRDRRWGITVEQVNALPEEYTSVIPIVAEPRTFMGLVPADQALDVVQAIKAKYEREMGKVRNRLPLTMGIIYGGRRTPLAALLDAGRRILRRSACTVQAEVMLMTPNDPLADGWPASAEVALKIGEREIAVAVLTVMGDDVTHDVWYPYWQVANKPMDRTRWFAGPDGEHWAHVCDLRQGDRVGFTPSVFDFEYLDTTARRFEVSYADDGQRRGKDKRQRPYLLEELAQIEQAWTIMHTRLTASQIKALDALIEGKRADWDEPCGVQAVSPTFRHFVREVLQQAGVRGADLEHLEYAAVCGMLTDALELHLFLSKEEKT
jgi:hypothetical protein